MGGLNLTNLDDGKIEMELCLDSGITDARVRKNLREKFMTKLKYLTGDKIGLGALTEYMQTYLVNATLGGYKMPSAAGDMLSRLNQAFQTGQVEAGYLEAIVTKCESEQHAGEVHLKHYRAKALRGSDLYCVSMDGTEFCYHLFGLVPKNAADGSSFLRVESDNESGIICFGCIGRSDDIVVHP
jgi:hypothetical protein